MKKIKYLFILWMIPTSVSFYSCTNDFFDKPQTSDVTIDQIFSNRLYAEQDFYSIYSQLVTRGFPQGDRRFFSNGMLASISDEADNFRGASAGTTITNVGMSTTSSRSNLEDDFVQGFVGIRQAYIFLENIDKVSEIPEAERSQMKLEVKLLIAMRYHEMIKRYGGVPIIRGSLNYTEKLETPRVSYKETVDFILELCAEADGLPDTQPSKWKGRMTRGVAMALKARTLLFAASPLYNTGETILSYSNPEFLSLGDYDVNRWKIAVDANLAVLTWAEQNGIALINTGNPFADYGNAVSLADNQEIILANKWSTTDNGFRELVRPFSIRGYSITFNFLPQFRKDDGTDQVWDEALDIDNPYTELTNKTGLMEPRFDQIVWVPGQAPKNTNLLPDKPWGWQFAGGVPGASAMRGVGRSVKYLYNYADEPFKDYPVFRLAEFYLNFAEAANEFYGPDAAVPGTILSAVSALNLIRERGGLPPLVATDKDLLRSEIKRERSIELFQEGHRNFDLRRWKESEVVGGPFYGFLFTPASGPYTKYRKVKTKDRFWAPNQYFYPFPQSEINKGYLIQNPGY